MGEFLGRSLGIVFAQVLPGWVAIFAIAVVLGFIFFGYRPRS
jgi:hypothetical protein